MSYGVSSRDSQTRSHAPSGSDAEERAGRGARRGAGAALPPAATRHDDVDDGDDRDFGGDAGVERRGAGGGRRARRASTGAAGAAAADGGGVDVAAGVDAQRVDFVVAGVEQDERLARRVDPEDAAGRFGAGEQPPVAIEGERHRVRRLGLVEGRALAVRA